MLVVDLDRVLPAEATADAVADEASRRGDTSPARSAYRRRLLAWARSLVLAGLLVAVAVPAVRGVAGGPAGCAAPPAGRANSSQPGDQADRRDRLTATRANAQRVGGSTSADGLLRSLLVQLRLWDQDGCMLQAGPSWTVCVSADDTTTAEAAIRRPGAGRPVGKLVVVARAASPGVVAVRVTPAPTARASAIGFTLPAGQDEHFFGLGERFRGPCLLGQVVDNWAGGFNDSGRRTSYSPMPLLLSSHGYGVLLRPRRGPASMSPPPGKTPSPSGSTPACCALR